jgi:putative hydrolase of the HAD superfamily
MINFGWHTGIRRSRKRNCDGKDYKTLRSFNYSDKDLAKKLDEFYVNKSPYKTRLFPGTLETIQTLHGKYHMFILTNGFAEVQYIKLESCGLQKFFEKVYISEHIGFQKPAREFFDFVLNDLGVTSASCLMIGDDEKTDIAGAKKCNIDTAYFNPKKTKTDCFPTYEISELKELLQILN